MKASAEFMGAPSHIAPPWYAEAPDQGYLTAKEHDELAADLFDLVERGIHGRVVTDFIVAGAVPSG